MPKDFTEQTIRDYYHDDYTDSDGYYKILFNSSRYLQARELTQLQTILQKQISRFADNIFQDGSAVTNASGGSGVDQASYVLIDTGTLGNVSIDRYVGRILKGPAVTNVHNGLEFTVTFASPSVEGTSYATLYGFYSSANQSGITSSDVQGQTLTFVDGDTINDEDLTPLTPLVVATRSGAPLSTGTGLLFTIQASDFYTQGHFVYVEKQEIVISAYEVDVDVDVGFNVIQDIVTVEDDVSLYDNQGAVPNLASPGADRYRIRLILTTKDAVANPLDFLPFAQVKSGFIVKIKTGNNNYNEIEDRMAVRQYDTNGDFIVNPFGLSYQAGNDESALTMNVLGLSNTGSATAFVDGYRLVQGYDSEYQILKPVSTTSRANTTTTVSYRNYIPVSNTTDPNAGLGEWPVSGDLRTQTRFKLFNVGNTQIGTTRIKSVVQTYQSLSPKGVQVHLYDVRMDDDQNFRDVDFISAATNTARMPVYLENNNAYIVDPEINTSLFTIPGGRAKSVNDVLFSSQRQFIQSSNASGGMSLGAGADDRFDNPLEWIFINLVDDVKEDNPTINIAGNTATVTGLTASKQYCVFALATDLGASAKIKTFTRSGYEEWTSANDSADFVRTGGEKYDGVRLLGAYRLDGATQVSVDDVLEFDGGQRDNYYSPITLKRAGIEGSIRTLYAKIDRFEWSDDVSAGDFFSVNSYKLVAPVDSTNTEPKFSYSDIPVYVSGRNGADYDLRNQFDFRSKLDPSLETMPAADRFNLPKFNGYISYDIEWYNRRVDNISLGYNPSSKEPEIRINQGFEELQPSAPQPITSEMILFSVNYGGNTISAQDMQVKTYSYKRFSMEDIGVLEQRIELLEETISLTSIEQSAVNLVELDSDGAVRSKTGFFVDDFTNGLSLTASPTGPIWKEDFASVGQTLLQTGETSYAIEPKNARAAVSLLFDSGGDTVGGYERGRAVVYNKLNNSGNTNFKHVGDTLYLDYIDTLDESLVNESISWKTGGVSYEEDGYYNVNPFNVFTGEGSLKLSPERDIWLDDIHLPDINITQTQRTITRLIPITNTIVDNGPFQSAQAEAARRNEVLDAGRVRPATAIRWGVGRGTSVTTTNVLSATSNTVLASTKNDRMVVSYPFTRSRPIYCKAQGLRPNTRYWAYFQDVDISQWIHALTEERYQQHLDEGDHLKTYQPVNVNILNHPDGATDLVTNRVGEVFYSFYLPNNASVPSNNGLSFTTFEEWAQWGQQQQSLASATSSSIKDPTVYDRIGWKFRGGILTMKLLDISAVNGQGPDESQALSRASMTYACMGFLRVQQTTRRYTRTLAFALQQVTNVNNGAPFLYRYDPLAQSFEVDARTGVPGVFVTKVDVFLRKAPKTDQNGGTQTAIPLQLQIRETEAGVPKAHPVTEQFRVYKSADDCYAVVDNINDLEDLDDVLANPVTFVFEEPLYLTGGVEYAIVLLAECDNYEAFISTTYGLVLGKTTSRINKQPASGSLFLSQNGSTWTAQQDQNMAYRIHTAKFKSEGSVNFYNSTYPKFVHNQLMMSVDSGDFNRFRVNQFAHGLGIGDSVALTGLIGGKDYLGLTGSQILDKDNVVNEADASGYFVNVPAGGSFTSGGQFGETACQSNTAFNFDRAVLNFESLNFQGTSIDYEGNFMSGNSLSKLSLSGVNDPRFARGQITTIRNLAPIAYTEPRLLGDSDMELDPQAANGPSIVLSANMKSTISSTFGNTTAQQQADGYVSDVSPIIDLQKCNFTMQNFQIDNQVDSAGESGNAVQNKPFFFVPETNPESGSSPSKQITKPVVLDQAASGIRVFVDINKPPSASFDLYYRLANADADIFGVSWIYAASDNNPPDNKFEAITYDPLNLDYSEYRYLLGGPNGNLVDFTSFQLKIVMKTTNTCEIPVIKAIRAIALI